MNEEEKKAIEKVKEIIYNPEFSNIILYDSEGFTGWNNNFETILNLIEKQQKEIEDLKNDHIDFWINTKEVEDMVRGKFINKDKIKEKIEELENLKEQITTNECMLELSASVEILKELLGE